MIIILQTKILCMKKYIALLVVAAIQISQPGCIKSSAISGSASLNLINALDSSTALVTNFQPLGSKGNFVQQLQYYATANQIPYGASWESGSYVGSVTLSLSDFSDTLHTLWSGTLDLPDGSIHSLFISGDTSAIDTLLTTDIIPFYPISDSVAGVRFINLSKGSLSMSVNLQGNLPSQTEFANLAYRQISEFKQYMANSNASGSYTFEIRDQATGNLLCPAFQWTYTVLKNNTIVIAGSENPNATTPIMVFQVNDF
jgi:hypothetical protein